MAISIGTDVVVTLYGLQDALTSTYLNSATVSGSLLTADRTSVYTFSMPYVSASSGGYRGTIPAATTADLTPGAAYIVQAVAVSGGNQKTFVEEHTAEYCEA